VKRITTGVLFIVSMINLYFLVAIILFKLSPVQFPTLLHQFQLVMERPFLLESRLQSANFVPFYTISKSLNTSIKSNPIQWMNLYGNLFIFVPTGVLVGLSVRKHKISSAVLVSFLLSLMLESLQLLLLMGSFDVDDLILNTLGGAVGAVLITILLIRRKAVANNKANDNS
jgi:glycopeptide antibiotics resistance protein